MESRFASTSTNQSTKQQNEVLGYSIKIEPQSILHVVVHTQNKIIPYMSTQQKIKRMSRAYLDFFEELLFCPPDIQ